MTDVLRRALGQRAFEGLSFRRLEPGYRVVWPDGTSFDLSSNIATFLGEIERFDPAPTPSSTLAFLADVHELYLEARSKILERDDSLLSFVGRLASRGRFRPWALGSLRRFVQRFFDNPRVVEALTFQSLYLGTSPLIAPAMYALLAAEEILGGVWYAAGGTGAIVAALVRQCEEHGVTFSFGSRVTRVLDDGHRARGVESATGTHYADGIVVTADREVAMQRLFAEPGHEPSPRYGHSAMVWYLGIDRRIGLPHHTVMLPSDPWTAYAQLDQGLLPSAPLVYLCNPAASDESVAPPGHSALVLLAPVPNRSTLFAFDARHFFERVMTVVERHAGPVAERIVYRSARGPAEFERELDVMHGAAFGPDHLLDQMGPFRPSIRHPRLSNVVFAGSGTKPGSGVPMVLISGRLAGQRLAEGDRMIAVRRNAGFERCFSAYLYWLVRRSFQTVWLRTSAALPHGGFVAAANHTSWWDGFVPFLIHRKLTPHSPFFILMSETELRRFAFFRWGGAFSIDAASKRKALESIRYAAEAVREGGGVWIFPQGSLTPAGSSLRFTSGFVHAARGGSGPIVPVALRFAMLSAQRPEAFVDFGPAIDPRHRDALVTTREIVASMVSEIDRHIFEGTVTSRFEPFIHGGRGVDESVSVLTAPYGRRL